MRDRCLSAWNIVPFFLFGASEIRFTHASKSAILKHRMTMVPKRIPFVGVSKRLRLANNLGMSPRSAMPMSWVDWTKSVQNACQRHGTLRSEMYKKHNDSQHFLVTHLIGITG